jgi:DNA-binding transcriptional regulator YdaS (Cro superfamily)
MHPMLFQNKNNVSVAVERAGGPTRVALLLECSGTSVHNWIRRKKITDIKKAAKLAKLVGMSVEDLRPCR